MTYIRRVEEVAGNDRHLHLHLFRPAFMTHSNLISSKPSSTTSQAPKMPNTVTYFDISIGGKPAGRIEFELFDSIAPKVQLPHEFALIPDNGQLQASLSG